MSEFFKNVGIKAVFLLSSLAAGCGIVPGTGGSRMTHKPDPATMWNPTPATGPSGFKPAPGTTMPSTQTTAPAASRAVAPGDPLGMNALLEELQNEANASSVGGRLVFENINIYDSSNAPRNPGDFVTDTQSDLYAIPVKGGSQSQRDGQIDTLGSDLLAALAAQGGTSAQELDTLVNSGGGVTMTAGDDRATAVSAIIPVINDTLAGDRLQQFAKVFTPDMVKRMNAADNHVHSPMHENGHGLEPHSGRLAGETQMITEMRNESSADANDWLRRIAAKEPNVLAEMQDWAYERRYEALIFPSDTGAHLTSKTLEAILATIAATPGRLDAFAATIPIGVGQDAAERGNMAHKFSLQGLAAIGFKTGGTDADLAANQTKGDSYLDALNYASAWVADSTKGAAVPASLDADGAQLIQEMAQAVTFGTSPDFKNGITFAINTQLKTARPDLAAIFTPLIPAPPTMAEAGPGLYERIIYRRGMKELAQRIEASRMEHMPGTDEDFTAKINSVKRMGVIQQFAAQILSKNSTPGPRKAPSFPTFA